MCVCCGESRSPDRDVRDGETVAQHVHLVRELLVVELSASDYRQADEPGSDLADRYLLARELPRDLLDKLIGQVVDEHLGVELVDWVGQVRLDLLVDILELTFFFEL